MRLTPKAKVFVGSAGFTLIEVIISITIMLVLVGGGIAAYSQFNDRQTLQSAGKQLLTLMRTAQTKARVGDKPSSGCTRLEGYAVQANQGSNQVRLVAICSNAAITRDTITLSGTAVVDSAIDVTFGGLRGGVTNPGVVSVSTPDQTYEITITSGGEMSGAVAP